MISRPIVPLPSRSSSVQSEVEPGDYPHGHATTAAQVYRDVWDDFYRWKAESAGQEMRELCVSVPMVRSTRRDIEGHDQIESDAEGDWISDHSYPSSYSHSSLDAEEPGLHSLDTDMSFLAFKDSMADARPKVLVQIHRQLPDELVDDDQSTFQADSYYVSMKSAFQENSCGIDREFSPHPRYFSCASTSRNLPYLADKGGLDFSPFEDDPSFDHPRYLELFPSFLWQCDFIDPDDQVEIVQLEAVRRLYHRLGLSFSQVDDLNFFTKLRKTQESGLLWDTSQRDLPWWPGAGLSNFPELHISDVQPKVPESDLFTHLKAGLKDFCGNTNCIHAVCGLHPSRNYPQLTPIKPSITSKGLQLLKGNPCGSHCFRYIDLSDDSQLEGAYWTDENDTITLKGVLQVSPDILPCDLSVIMHAKCRDVFIYRTHHYPDSTVDDNPVFQRTSLPLNHIYSKLPVPPNRVLRVQGVIPQRMIRQVNLKTKELHSPPSLHVIIRDPAVVTPGVNASSSPTIANATASVVWTVLFDGKGVIANLDPGERRALQKNVHAWQRAGSAILNYVGSVMQGKRSHKKLICNNVDSQRGQYPLLHVSRGSWGLGAFTTQKILANQLVGEYTGELLSLDSEVDANQVSPLADHTGLNYTFDLNNTHIIDSMFVGNEMRYLNHEGPITEEQFDRGQRSTANCRGRVVYVNNCHRILFYANRRIEPGSELFIDYGVNYWTSKDDWVEGKSDDFVFWR